MSRQSRSRKDLLFIKDKKQAEGTRKCDTLFMSSESKTTLLARWSNSPHTHTHTQNFFHLLPTSWSLCLALTHAHVQYPVPSFLISTDPTCSRPFPHFSTPLVSERSTTSISSLKAIPLSLPRLKILRHHTVIILSVLLTPPAYWVFLCL